MPTPQQLAALQASALISPQIDLSRSRFEAPFFVDMEAFFEFSFWMSEELLDLENQFRDRANAGRKPMRSAQAASRFSSEK